jgi:hypothetical protein
VERSDARICKWSAIGAIALNLPHLAHFEADYVRGVPIAAFDIRSDEDNRNLHEDLSMSIHSKRILVDVQLLIHHAK